MREKQDAELVARIDRGETEALDELYRRYAGKLYVYCAATMSSPVPEDMVHDVFLRVVRSSSQFDPRRASFAAWLFRIARNLCLDASRHEAQVPMTSLDDVGEAGAPADGEGRVDEELDRTTVMAAVRACVERLQREEERQAFVLYYLVGKIYREVGEALGKSTSMAQKLVGLARERMRHCLSGKGVSAW